MNDHLKTAIRDTAVQQARFEWMQKRIEQVRRNVSAYDVLRRHGVDIKSDVQEEQFSCPFHGADNRPSARIYPDNATSPSHVWCYVCQEKRWDAIGLWRKFNGGEEVSFGRALSEIERAYNLPSIEMPKEIGLNGPTPDQKAFEAFDTLYTVTENRLRMSRNAYHRISDMTGYLAASSILDKLRHRIDQRQIAPVKAIETLNQLLAKIREKVRECPDG